MNPLKARSYRSVMAVGFQHYTEQFRSFFKASWITAIVMAVLFGAIATTILIAYPATMSALIFLIVMPLVMPLVYALVRRLLKRHRSFWQPPRGNYALRLRHCGIIVGVLLTSALLVMLACCIELLPAGILCMANLQALQGMMIGDPSGMPSYMIGLTFGTFTLTAFMQFYVSQIMLVHHYYACGSIEAKEADRQKQKLDI